MSEQQDRPESLLGCEPHTSGLEPERGRSETSVPTDSSDYARLATYLRP